MSECKPLDPGGGGLEVLAHMQAQAEAKQAAREAGARRKEEAARLAASLPPARLWIEAGAYTRPLLSST